jgi:2'-hydroxyisoflavone reductase
MSVPDPSHSAADTRPKNESLGDGDAPGSLLVLGGTRFVGRVLVERALLRGDDVTLFNRGLTNPSLFPEAHHLRGDRSFDLSALRGRRWSTVVDVAGYDPNVVAKSLDALRDHVDRYVFVSTLSVYADHNTPDVQQEDCRLENDLTTYGGRKTACEALVREAFGDRALIVRPGLIVGRYDSTDRFTYWPRRIAAGGTVLAPGAPGNPLQSIDVRDLADWILRAAPAGCAGAFNAAGRQMQFSRFLEECCAVTGRAPALVWVSTEQLLAAGADPWMGVPLWIGAPGWEAANRVDISKAVSAGLTFRPLFDTIRDAYEWDMHRGDRIEGLSRVTEDELLRSIHQPRDGGRTRGSAE